MNNSGATASAARLAVKAGLLVAIVLCLGLSTRPAHADWSSLTGPLPDYTTVRTYVVSPDSSLVAFTADIETDDVVELYAVPLTGTVPIKLNPPLVKGGNVAATRIAFTPDSQFVLYLADQDVDNRVELYRVPVGGGPAVRLSPQLVPGGNVVNFTVDEDSGRIVYTADQETNEVLELWSVPILGGAAVKVNGPFVSGGNIGLYQIDPLSNRVVYSADAETDGKFELYSAPIAGGAAVKLNPPIVLTGGGDSGIFSDFAVSPIVPVVVLIARQADMLGGRLYSIPTAGGPANLLSFNMLSTQRILSFRISPAGDRVIFNVGTRDGGTQAFKGNLYSALIGGGGAANVTETADPLFGTDNYRFLPNGSRVVYAFQNNAAGQPRLESATVLGGRTPLYLPGQGDAPLVSFSLSPNSLWVMYQAGSGGFERTIRTIPPTGGGPTSIGSGSFNLITPDSSRVIYTNYVDASNHSELHSAQIFGGGDINLSGLGGTGFVSSAAASPDSASIVFRVQLDGQEELRVSDGTEAQPSITGLSAANDGPKLTNVPINFTTTITGGESVSYVWNFGDGSSGSGAATSHAYGLAGVYTATVQAISAGNSKTATTTVYVGDAVVDVVNNAYTPQNVTVGSGGTVVWVLKEGTHSVTADDGSFEQPAGSNWPPFVHVFTAPASTDATVIPYHCSLHGQSMSGTVTISGLQMSHRALMPIVRR